MTNSKNVLINNLKIILDSFSISIIICMIFLLYLVDITLKDLLNNILLNVLLLFVISIIVSMIISKLYNGIFYKFIDSIISNVLNNNYLTETNNKLYSVIIRKGYVR